MITIIFAPPRTGKTCFMTHIAHETAFDYDRNKRMRQEILHKRQNGFEAIQTVPQHCVAANYDMTFARLRTTIKNIRKIVSEKVCKRSFGICATAKGGNTWGYGNVRRKTNDCIFTAYSPYPKTQWSVCCSRKPITVSKHEENKRPYKTRILTRISADRISSKYFQRRIRSKTSFRI